MTVANILILLKKAKMACNVANVTLRLPVFVLGAYDRLLLAVSRTFADTAAKLRDIKRHHRGVLDAMREMIEAAFAEGDRRVVARRRQHGSVVGANRRDAMRRAIDRAVIRSYKTVPIVLP